MMNSSKVTSRVTVFGEIRQYGLHFTANSAKN